MQRPLQRPSIFFTHRRKKKKKKKKKKGGKSREQKRKVHYAGPAVSGRESLGKTEYKTTLKKITQLTDFALGWKTAKAEVKLFSSFRLGSMLFPAV